jgi:hypothetical protein
MVLSTVTYRTVYAKKDGMMSNTETCPHESVFATNDSETWDRTISCHICGDILFVITWAEMVAGRDGTVGTITQKKIEEFRRQSSE